MQNLAEFSEQLGQSVNQLSASNSDEHKVDAFFSLVVVVSQDSLVSRRSPPLH